MLFSLPREKPSLVGWAFPGEWIPLKCSFCKAIFTTRNKGTIGTSPIHYGRDYEACRKCERAGHKISDLVPDKDLFARKGW